MAVPASQVILGPVTFLGREVPDVMPFGGKHKLHVHKQIGGKRVIDAMGPDPRDISWNGIFYQPAAAARARLIDSLKDTGVQLLLQWGSFGFYVVIEEFTADYHHEWFVQYHISCTVLQQGPSLPAPNLNQVIQTDLTAIGVITGTTIAL